MFYRVMDARRHEIIENRCQKEMLFIFMPWKIDIDIDILENING